MTIQIQHRRGTAAEWTAANPTLAAGEMGVETDTLKVKMGNGTTAWTSLPYFTQGAKGDTGATGNTGPTGATGPTGPRGLTGPANSLTVGTVTGGAAGSTPVVEITGDAPNQSVAFTIPKGDKGDAATVAVGTTSATAAGTSPTVTNSGTSGAAVLDFTIPNGVGVPTGGTTGQIIRKTASATEWADNKLNDLKDVTLTSPAEGQGLTYDGAKWVNATPVSALSGLSDVTVTSPVDKQVLAYESGKWKNKQATGGVSVSDTTPASPIDGDALFYSADGTMFVRYNDGTSVQWVQPNAVLSSQIEQRYYSPNYVINGGFDIWQRGTSVAMGTNTYTADRWFGYRGTGAATVSRVAGTGSQYAAKVQRNSGNTSTEWVYLSQSVETLNSIPLAGKTVTVSFYAKSGANFSGSNLNFSWFSGTGTDQNFILAITGQVSLTNTNISLTSTLTRYSFTATVPANATQTGFWFGYIPAGTAGADDSFTVERVQLEEGSTATPFRRNANSIQGELAACQRYYFRLSTLGTSSLFGAGSATSGNDVYITIKPPVVMRAKPASFDYSSQSHFSFFAAAQGTLNGITSFILDGWSTAETVTLVVSKTSSVVGDRPYLFFTNAANSYIGFSAEL